MRVAVIGLGVMGLPMAKNLVRAGFDVVGYNRSPAKVRDLVSFGGEGASSVSTAVRDADVILTMLPDSPDVEEVLLGPHGVLATARAGCVWIDSSTISPAAAVALGSAAEASGIHAIDAPVSGGQKGAVDATLSMMVGGEADIVETVLPVLHAVGASVTHLGPIGSGQIVKAANQLLVAGNLQLVAEALVFVDAHGVDVDRAVAALAAGLAGSRVLDQKATAMMRHHFEPGFRVDLHDKDLRILIEAARGARTAMPLGVLVAQFIAALAARGHGGLDHAALILNVEEMSGRSRVS